MSQSNVFQVFMAAGVQMKVTFGVSTLCSDFIATEQDRIDSLASAHLNVSTFHRMTQFNYMPKWRGEKTWKTGLSKQWKKNTTGHISHKLWPWKGPLGNSHPSTDSTQVLSPLSPSAGLTGPAPSNCPTQPRPLFRWISSASTCM